MQALIKVSLLTFLVLILIVSLFAPFTFMKPSDISSLQSKFSSVKKLGTVTNKDVTEKPVPKKTKEKPLHNVILPDFAAMKDIPSKKKMFFDFIRPAVIKQNKTILATRATLEHYLEQITLEIGLTAEEEVILKSFVKRYRVSKNSSSLQQIETLLARVDVIPVSLVLVQAANESAWGTSRFARIGLNFFGIWCYQPKCGMVPSGRNAGAKHEVAAFKSVEEAVVGYFNNINTHNAYHIFRTIRAQLRAANQPLSPSILATGLLAYSERGADYIVDITDMLRHNQHYFGHEETPSELGD